ncbi:hypothetical protein ACEQ8H_002030 [Pleosporales sp. CAS-2024a]
MVDQGAASAYNVCLGQQDAVIPTKSVLTVVASSIPTTTTTSQAPKSTVPSMTTTTSRTLATSTQSIIIDSLSSTSSVTSLPTSTFVAAPASANPPPKMTPAQIAGLSVAAVAAFIIAVGLMALSVCLRRKRERRKSLYPDEKGSSHKSTNLSSRFSHYVVTSGATHSSSHFPKALGWNTRREDTLAGFNPKTKNQATPANPTRPVQRNGVGTSNSWSNSSWPLSQIGVAISAEFDGSSAMPRTAMKPSPQANPSMAKQSKLNVPLRPLSAMTQDTVFEEEDDTVAQRRSSILLPTPPVPVPPIRSLQPSKKAANLDIATGFPDPPTNDKRRSVLRSELFLEIPVRHEKPPPRRIMAAHIFSTGSPQPRSQASRLAPAVWVAASESPQKSPGSSYTSDIDDYYFSSYKTVTPRLAPAYQPRLLKDSPRAEQVKTKRSGSTISRTTSRTSTNLRDSASSQTSFETADPSDATPEDEDDDKKQLFDDSKLSPVAESPISKLRYPKVPRASNQLVPRSPRSPPPKAHFKSPTSHSTPRRRHQPSPPSAAQYWIQNRGKDVGPPLLETRV